MIIILCILVFFIFVTLYGHKMSLDELHDRMHDVEKEMEGESKNNQHQ